MEISHIGHACFRLKGKTGTLITDPYDPASTGLPFPKDLTADIVTVSHSHPDHNFTSFIKGNFKTLTLPGEYEIGGISLIGVATFHDEKNGQEKGKNTCFVIEMDGLRLFHLGNLGHLLTQEQLNEIGQVDIVFVPTGPFLTPQKAADIVKQLEPEIVIPMHYREEKTAPELATKLYPVEDFLKIMGLQALHEARYIISREKLPEELTVVVLDSKA